MELPTLTELGRYGLLGLLLIISLGVNWYFIKTIEALNDKRVADAKELTSKIMDPLNTIKTNGETLISLFQRLLDKSK